MRGFVRAGESTNYFRVVRELERAVTRLGSASSKYFQFGTTIKAIRDIPVAGRVVSTGFYEDPDLHRETRIEKVLEQVDPAGLTVIATDLFQNRAEMTLLVGAVRRKLLPHKLALGIWGFRSEYDGTVFDAGTSAGGFAYRSTKDPRSYRPAYLIVAGKWPYVVHLANSLTQTSKSLSPQNLLILSPELVQQPLQWRDVLVKQARDLSEDRRIVEAGPCGAGAFRVLDRDKEAALEVEVPFHPVPYTPAVDFARLEALGVTGKHLVGRAGTTSDLPSATTPKHVSLSAAEFTESYQKSMSSLADAVKASSGPVRESLDLMGVQLSKFSEAAVRWTAFEERIAGFYQTVAGAQEQLLDYHSKLREQVELQTTKLSNLSTSLESAHREALNSVKQSFDEFTRQLSGLQAPFTNAADRMVDQAANLQKYSRTTFETLLQDSAKQVESLGSVETAVRELAELIRGQQAPAAPVPSYLAQQIQILEGISGHTETVAKASKTWDGTRGAAAAATGCQSFWGRLWK